MKKVKIMLLSLILFTIVGGALAFKARFNENFCSTIVTGRADCAIAGLKCPNDASQFTFDTGFPIYCTTPRGATEICDQFTNCLTTLPNQVTVPVVSLTHVENK